MHGSHRALLVAAVLALTGALASCGGDDAPTQEDFADRANEICRDTKQALLNVGENVEGPEDIVDAVDRVIEESRDTVDELDDLERPEGAAGETAEGFVDATRKEIQDVGVPALEDLREAVRAEDQQAVQEAATRLQEIDSSAANSAATRAARKVGANACAEG